MDKNRKRLIQKRSNMTGVELNQNASFIAVIKTMLLTICLCEYKMRINGHTSFEFNDKSQIVTISHYTVIKTMFMYFYVWFSWP